MELIDLAAMFSAMVLAAVVITALAKIISGKTAKHYDGVLQLNNTDPDKPAYTLMIDQNCDLNNVDSITLYITRN